MRIELAPEQKRALETILTWRSALPHPYLTLGGYAGTGKTTLMALLRMMLFKLQPKSRVAFCAYTGKASRVLAAALDFYKAKQPKDTVSTIHSLAYAPVVDKAGHVTGWQRRQEIKADLIIVDEASMIDRTIWEDLLSFGVPILAVGDHGQLPPINPGFNLMVKPDIRLETIHRQAADNPIIKVSMLARTEGVVPVGKFGKGVRKISRQDPECGYAVEAVLTAGRRDTMVLVGFNRTRLQINNQVRAYMGFEDTEPHAGDKVICLRNNRENGIYNGMTGQIKQIMPCSEAADWYEAEIVMEEDDFIYTGKVVRHQFNQETTLKAWPGIPPRHLVDLFDFGYALTVHKAQGSQAPKVLLFEERSRHMSDDDWSRWLYTGITRAEEELTIVGD